MAKPVVLLTGGGAGIGAGIARVLGSRGWRVAVNDVNAAAAEAIAREVGGVALAGDIREAAGDLVARAASLDGRLDGLVNNAGIIRRSDLAETSSAEFDEVLGVNLKAMLRLSQAALPHLEKHRGSIVNISSVAAVIPQVGGGAYSMSKAGVSALTRQAAAEWGPRGVRVNAVAPGLVRTAMAEAVYSVPELHEKRRMMIPLRRIGVPEDIGKVVAFLLSEDAGFVSGQTIEVDGAFTQTLIGLLPHPVAAASSGGGA